MCLAAFFVSDAVGIVPFRCSVDERLTVEEVRIAATEPWGVDDAVWGWNEMFRAFFFLRGENIVGTAEPEFGSLECVR